MPQTVLAAALTGTLTDRSGTITTAGTSQTAIPANVNRAYMLIMNPWANTTSLWINFTTAAVQASPSIELVPGATFTFETRYLSTEAVTITGGTTSMPFTAKEG